jgi:hypothetical protein
VNVLFHQGVSDRNIRREQSQVIIQNSYIRESRDYGIFSEAPARLQDPRDVIDPLDFFDDRNSVSLQNIRSAVEHLRMRGVNDLERMTLMSDGATIYECASADEMYDLVQGGQGVFGIAVGRVWHEVEGSLSNLQGEVNGQIVGGENNDELSQRRARKGA